MKIERTNIVELFNGSIKIGQSSLVKDQVVVNKKDLEDLESENEKLKDIVEEISNFQPYPEKIFTPIDDVDYDKIDKLLEKEFGFRIDRLSGQIGRELWNRVSAEIKRKWRSYEQSTEK